MLGLLLLEITQIMPLWGCRVMMLLRGVLVGASEGSTRGVGWDLVLTFASWERVVCGVVEIEFGQHGDNEPRICCWSCWITRVMGYNQIVILKG